MIGLKRPELYVCSLSMNPWGRCRSSWCASMAFFSHCGYSPPHSSIKQECEIEKNLCVSVVTARGCTCSGSVLSLCVHKSKQALTVEW